MQRLVTLLFLLLTALGTVYAPGGLMGQTYNTFPIGQYWHFPDARSMGLAGAGSISNATGASLSLNPAGLSKNSTKLMLQLTPAVFKLEERRSYPIYNRIDDVTQQGIYVINNNWHPFVQGDISMGFDIAAFPYLKAVAIGMHNEVNQDYLYEEEVRENIFGDFLLAHNKIQYKGKLNRYSFGAGFDTRTGLHLGFQVGVLQGDLQKDSSITYFQSGFGDDVNFTRQRDLDNTPIVASVGAIFDIDERVSVGGHVQIPYTVDYKFSDDLSDRTGMESIEYPLQITGAFEYRAQQILQARLNIDFTYERWSETQHTFSYLNQSTERENLDDAIAVKAGIEHIFHNKIPFQVGLQYRTSYLDRSQSRTLLSAGAGFIGSNWQVDAAGGFSNLDYSFPDLFDDTLYGGDRSITPQDQVKESFFFGMVTLRVYPLK